MHIPDLSGLPRLSRRGFIVLGLGACAAAALPLSLRRRRQLVRRSLPVMGTIAEIAVIAPNPRDGHAAIDAAFAELERVERTMSRFIATSDVGQANSLAAVHPVRIEPATAAVLQESCRWAEASDGAFDPCIGAVIALWDVENRHQPPSAEKVRELAGRKLYSALRIEADSKGGLVQFSDRDALIDLGGIAKGYGVDRTVQALRERGIKQAFVNVGGDLYAMGRSDDGDPWKVGIRSPEDPTHLADTIEVADAAVATSGDYLRFFDYGGRRYHHLFDPITGAPRASGVRSVTVIAERCMTADAAATTVFVEPGPRAEQTLRAAAPDARIIKRI